MVKHNCISECTNEKYSKVVFKKKKRKEKKTVIIPDLLVLKNNWLINDFAYIILTDVFLPPVHQHIKNLKNHLLIIYRSFRLWNGASLPRSVLMWSSKHWLWHTERQWNTSSLGNCTTVILTSTHGKQRIKGGRAKWRAISTTNNNVFNTGSWGWYCALNLQVLQA